MIGKNKRNARRDEEKKKAEESGGTVVVGKNSPAMIRLRKEFNEIDLPKHASVQITNPDDLMHFKVTIDLRQEECRWQGGVYIF